MVGYFLRSRFRTVRFFFPAATATTYITVDGYISDTQDHTVRYETFTDWYNVAHDTQYPLWWTDVFAHIHVTTRLSILDVLETVKPKEIAEFRDESYRSSLAFGYLLRRLCAKGIPCDKKQTLHIEWEGNAYSVRHANIISISGACVERFLDTMGNPDETPVGVYYITPQGSRVLLTEEGLELGLQLQLPKSVTIAVAEGVPVETQGVPASVHARLAALEKEVAELRHAIHALRQNNQHVS
jgi:hypothetical protein